MNSFARGGGDMEQCGVEPTAIARDSAEDIPPRYPIAPNVNGAITRRTASGREPLAHHDASPRMGSWKTFTKRAEVSGMAPFLSFRSESEGALDVCDLPVLESGSATFARGPERTMTWNTPPLTN